MDIEEIILTKMLSRSMSLYYNVDEDCIFRVLVEETLKNKNLGL